MPPRRIAPEENIKNQANHANMAGGDFAMTIMYYCDVWELARGVEA